MTAQVLFIDDEEHLRVACSQALELAGFDVESHASAGDALERIDSHWPGVIVTDVKMAGMTGLELMTTALERDPELPVILFTGHGSATEAERGMQGGAFDYVMKPVDIDVLVEKIRNAAAWTGGRAS